MASQPTLRFIQSTAPYGDRGPFQALVEPHDYLYCWDCGSRLWIGTAHAFVGVTHTETRIFACLPCKQVADVRMCGGCPDG